MIEPPDAEPQPSDERREIAFEAGFRNEGLRVSQVLTDRPADPLGIPLECKKADDLRTVFQDRNACSRAMASDGARELWCQEGAPKVRICCKETPPLSEAVVVQLVRSYNAHSHLVSPRSAVLPRAKRRKSSSTGIAASSKADDHLRLS